MKTSYKVVALEKFKDWDAVKLTFSAEETGAETKSSVKGNRVAQAPLTGPW